LAYEDIQSSTYFWCLPTCGVIRNSTPGRPARSNESACRSRKLGRNRLPSYHGGSKPDRRTLPKPDIEYHNKGLFGQPFVENRFLGFNYRQRAVSGYYLDRQYLCSLRLLLFIRSGLD